MHAAASVLRSHGMLEVQHLVVHQIFDGVARRVLPVEDTADHDGVVRRIVVSEQATCAVFAPGELRTAHESVKETRIQAFKHFIEIVMTALSGGDSFASARLADALAVPHHHFAGSVAPVAVGVRGVDRLAIELGQQDVRNGAQNILRRSFKQVGKMDLDATFAQTDRRVEAGEAVEPDFKRRHRSTRTQDAILLLEQLQKLGVH